MIVVTFIGKKDNCLFDSSLEEREAEVKGVRDLHMRSRILSFKKDKKREQPDANCASKNNRRYSCSRGLYYCWLVEILSCLSPSFFHLSLCFFSSSFLMNSLLFLCYKVS